MLIECVHNNSDAEQRELARHSSGVLPAAIVNGFNAVSCGEDDDGKLTLYSAHDNTIMALLAQVR